jgi:hypothetical protein
MISGCCHDADDICALVGYYAARNGNLLPTFRDNVSVPSSRVKKSKKPSWLLKMGPIGCPETSVQSYHSTLRNIAEECRSPQFFLSSLMNSFCFLVSNLHYFCMQNLTDNQIRWVKICEGEPANISCPFHYISHSQAWLITEGITVSEMLFYKRQNYIDQKIKLTVIQIM